MKWKSNNQTPNFKPQHKFFITNPQYMYQTLIIGSGKSNPLPLAWLIHGDAPKLNLKLPLLLKISLIFSSCSSSPKTPSFPLLFLFWLLFFQWEEMRKKNVFYKLFLLASSHALVWFWCVRLERKTRKVFGWKENEESGFMITLLTN